MEAQNLPFFLGLKQFVCPFVKWYSQTRKAEFPSVRGFVPGAEAFPFI